MGDTKNGFYVTAEEITAENAIFLPENWGQQFESLKQIDPTHYEREMAYEQVRAKDFPEKPSRLYGNFLFETLDSARWYVHTLGENCSIYSATFASDLKQHYGPYLLSPYGAEKVDDTIINRYWSSDAELISDGRITYSPFEIVIDGQFEVIGKIDFITGNVVGFDPQAF
ncbi:hypothetical protein RMR21_009670 [Agrobacterium sp. rho-8.1]|nr:hypothetical protein [Agrobacterium sp. rho-8.1]